MDIQEYIKSGVIELYVMGLCSADEEKELEHLRLQHPALNEAIIAFEKEYEAKLQQQAIMPDAATDKRILHTLNSLAGSKQVTLPTMAPVKKMTWWKVAAAACIALLAGSVYMNISQNQKNKSLAALLSEPKSTTLPLADYKIFTDPTITPVAMYCVGSHAICRCTMFWDKKTGKAYIMIHHLPQSSETKDYQLWANVDGKPLNVGIINDQIRGRFIEVSNVPTGAASFSVTLEKAGGTTTPTVNETYLQGTI
jgi:anti-sigma-K factor RskA